MNDRFLVPAALSGNLDVMRRAYGGIPAAQEAPAEREVKIDRPPKPVASITEGLVKGGEIDEEEFGRRMAAATQKESDVMK